MSRESRLESGFYVKNGWRGLWEGLAPRTSSFSRSHRSARSVDVQQRHSLGCSLLAPKIHEKLYATPETKPEKVKTGKAH